MIIYDKGQMKNLSSICFLLSDNQDVVVLC